jgi:hypothetical protein
LPLARKPTSTCGGSRPYSFRFDAVFVNDPLGCRMVARVDAGCSNASRIVRLDFHRLDELPFAVDLLQPRRFAFARPDPVIPPVRRR